MFTILDEVSWPGSPGKPNEDFCGASGDWAWVIDTSIFPGTPPIMGEGSDAAWLARFATGRLSDLAAREFDGDGVALLRHVMEEARVAFLARAPEDRQDPVTWPLGAMTLIRRNGDSLDVWTFADTTAFVRPPGQPVVTLGEAPELRVREAANAAKLLQASGATPKTIQDTPAFREWLAERRRRPRRDQGPALLGLDPSAAGRLRHQAVSCPDGTIVLLTSDGFSALVDLYREMDAQALVDAALAGGLEPLVRRAREIETQVDPEGRRFPRFKESDDATALLLRV